MELRRSCSKKRLRIIKRLSLASPIATAEKKDKKKPDKNTAKKTKRRPINDNQENITSLRKHLSDQNILKRYQSRKDKITTFNHMAIQDPKKCLKPVQTQIYAGQKPLLLYKSKCAGGAFDDKNKYTSDHSGATDDDSIPSESQSPSPSRRSLQENLERSSSVSRISEPGQNNEFHHQFSFETRKRQRYLSHRRLPREEHSPRRSPKRRRSTSREPLFEGEPSPRRSSERRRSESRELLSEGEPSLQRSPKRRRSTSREPLLEGEPSPRRSLERRRSTSREPLLEGEPSPRRSSERRRSTSRKPLFEGEPSPRRSLERRRPPPRELLSEGKPSPRRSLER
ncbi:serine/arginine repetitive matrix protein 1-like [Cotesia glomerata]|uniref:serine/arginine repetitive matrix protein 1-like n=1 Tax=Cotesia glomerata TaxID=32391 RepID=UPI001D011D17|nr:serine/arginine repetitive matrix protein 1-like [Cotesia glomerata]